jgi:Polyphosphate kinase 2 (PPK2)
MDAAGKDSAIEHVMSGVNPQGVQVFSFKKPSSEDSHSAASSSLAVIWVATFPVTVTI